MASLFIHRFLISLAILATSLNLANTAWGQDADVDPCEPAVAPDGTQKGGEFRNEIEPGVVVFGKSHRFAEVGQCQAFDSSPDGRTLVFAAGKLKFFDLRNNEIIDEAGEPNEHYQGVIYSPDGRYVFAQTFISGSTLVRVFDAIDMSSVGTITTRKDESKPANQFYIQSVCVSADAKYVALASHNEVQVRDVETGELVCSHDQLGYVQGMAFSPDETQLFVPNRGRIVVIDLETGEPVKKSASKLVNQQGNSIAVNLSRNLAALPSGASVTVFDLEQNVSKGSISMPKQAYPQSVAFSDDGSLLAITASQQSAAVIVVADVDKKRVVKTIKVAAQGVTRSRFATDNTSLFVSGHGIFGVQEVLLDSQDEVSDSKYPVGPAKTAVIHPNGKSFVTCSQGGEITWFDISTGEVLRSIRKANVRSAELTKDGSELLLVSQWGNQEPITRIDFETGETRKTYAVKSAAKKGSVFSQIRSFMLDGGPSVTQHSQAYAIDGKLSADGSEISSLVLELNYRQVITAVGANSMEQEFALRFNRMDVETGKRLASTKFDPTEFGFSNNQWIQQGAVREDGSQFAVARQNQVFVVDAESGETIADYQVGESGQVSQLQYSPNGKFLVASNFKGLWIWGADSGEEVKSFETRGGSLFSFSRDGSRMAVGGTGKTSVVEIFETDSWKNVLTRNKSEANRQCVALSDDGRQLLIGLADCRVELWDLPKLGR